MPLPLLPDRERVEAWEDYPPDPESLAISSLRFIAEMMQKQSELLKRYKNRHPKEILTGYCRRGICEVCGDHSQVMSKFLVGDHAYVMCEECNPKEIEKRLRNGAKKKEIEQGQGS